MRRLATFLVHRRFLGLLVVVGVEIVVLTAVPALASGLFGVRAGAVARVAVTVAMVAIAIGWLGWIVRSSRKNMAAAASAEPSIVATSAEAVPAVRRAVAAYAVRGFSEHGAWTLLPRPPHSHVDDTFVLLVDASRTIVARATAACLEVYSRLDDGRLVMTTTLRADVAPPRTIVQSVRHRIDAVLDAHREALRILSDQGSPPCEIDRPDVVLQDAERRCRAFVAEHGSADLLRRLVRGGLGLRRSRTLGNGRARAA